MTLKPSEVTPLSMHGSRAYRKNENVKKQVIDWRHDSHWHAIHHPGVNGVVQRRRPIRAIESYLDSIKGHERDDTPFVLNQSRLRKELESRLPLPGQEDELRRKFLINDIATTMRVFIAQSKTRDFCLQICPKLPDEFTFAESPLFLIMNYRGLEVAFRQQKSKDERKVGPYANSLFHGGSYQPGYGNAVEWKCHANGPETFYLFATPMGRGKSRF